ncbi:hypothetical protein PCE1_004337 [Barthelona sp. PCE]
MDSKSINSELAVASMVDSPLLGDRHDGKIQDKQTYGSFHALAYLIAYAVGTGVLNLPSQALNSGIRMAIVTLIINSIFLYQTYCLLADAMSFAPTVDRLNKTGTTTLHLDYEIERKIELPELINIIIGRNARRFYQGAITFYMIGSLWSYAATFSGSLTQEFSHLFGVAENCDPDLNWSPACNRVYVYFMLAFTVICIFLTLKDLADQAIIQGILAVFRFVVLFIMIITATIGYFTVKDPMFADPHIPADWNWRSIVNLFPAVAFSQIGHHSVPGLVHPLKNKKKLKWLFFGAIALTFVFYTMLIISTVVFFGDKTAQLITLNWIKYPWTGAEPNWWQMVIKQTVILFVPINVLSCFPINAITLGNNLLDSVPPEKRTKKVQVGFLLLAAIPPLIAATFSHTLSAIVVLAGCFGFFICLVFPSVLFIKSRDRIQKHLKSRKVRGPYHSWFSNFGFSALYSIVGVVACFVSLYFSIRNNF